MKFLARSNPDSPVSGASITASLIVMVSPSIVVKSRVSPSMTLVTVPLKFDDVAVTEPETNEVAQT